jgi:predicted transposase/invertase (TIGR01784 family)
MNKGKTEQQQLFDTGTGSEQAVFINPLTDFGFKKVFGEEEVAIEFLNDIVAPEEKITEIRYCPTEQLGDWETSRKAVFDLVCSNEKGESFLVEMQKAKQEFIADRLLFYSTFLIRNQAPKGKWDFELKAVYVVSVLDFVLFEEEEDKSRIINKVRLFRENVSTPFSKKLTFVFVELPKFNKPIEAVTGKMEYWLFCLRNLMRLQEVPEAIQEQVFIRLFEIARINKLTPEEMEAYQKSVLEYDDIVEALKYERKLSEARGEAEKAVEVTLNAKNKGFSVEEIACLTNLTAEQVQEILQKHNNR